MKKIIITATIVCLLLGTYGFISKKYYSPYATVLPVNAMDTGVMVPAALFSTWIGGVAPVVNVFVKPANSVTFNEFAAVPGLHVSNPANARININFHRWTEQMMLWILSPIPSTGGYGSCSGLVLNSPEFYDVSTPDALGLRTLTKHVCSGLIISAKDSNGKQYTTPDVGTSMSLDIKGRSNGAKNLPVLFEKETHNIFDVDKTPKSKAGIQLVYDANGNKVEVSNVKVVKGKPVLYDMKGKVILNPKLILSRTDLDPNTTVQQFTNKDFSLITLAVPIGGTITIIVPVQGQDTGDVLMAKNGSLIYYNMMVNDVYAVFLTMIKNGIIPNTTRFPTTAADLAPIQAYATLKGITLIEPNSLAMELKTAWIETTNLPNVADYVTVKAVIPKYTLTSTTTWTRNGTKTATLALVGMHVVGTVAGHPEMVWGSIEHVNNTPNRQYTFQTNLNTVQTIAADTNFGAGTPWLFSSATATSFNISHMKMGGALNEDITAVSPFLISGSDTQRTKPFGWLSSAIGLTESRSNAQVIAINTDVNSRLVGTDVRKKYFHIGSTWNISATNFAHVGTNQLSNSTMETYSQFANNSGIDPALGSFPDSRTNCFGCHNANNSNDLRPELSFLSHIFNSKPIVP